MDLSLIFSLGPKVLPLASRLEAAAKYAQKIQADPAVAELIATLEKYQEDQDVVAAIETVKSYAADPELKVHVQTIIDLLAILKTAQQASPAKAPDSY